MQGRAAPYDAGITRTNFSPGEYRDLSKPLVEVDPDAPRKVRIADRVLRAYVNVILVVGVAFAALLVLMFAALALTNSL